MKFQGRGTAVHFRGFHIIHRRGRFHDEEILTLRDILSRAILWIQHSSVLKRNREQHRLRVAYTSFRLPKLLISRAGCEASLVVFVNASDTTRGAMRLLTPCTRIGQVGDSTRFSTLQRALQPDYRSPLHQADVP